MFTPLCLFEPTLVTNAITTFYTSPVTASVGGSVSASPTKTLIKKVTAYNTSGTAATLTVYLVQKGFAAGSGNIAASVTVPATTVLDLPTLVGHLLETGDFIAATSGTNGVIAMRASGAQIQ
jgi:hypothetical protein